MNIHNVIPSGHLWHVSDVLPQNIVDLIYSVAWQDLDYQRLQIGNSKRRLIHNHYDQLKEIHSYVLANTVPSIEQFCSVKFTELHKFSINWWIDEPGFQPRIHTDGDLPSAMQLYWLPQNRKDLGTAFYHDRDKKCVIKEFANNPNSGYLMFNAHCDNGNKIDLWHDMLKPVPDHTVRLCSYFWFGSYCIL